MILKIYIFDLVVVDVELSWNAITTAATAAAATATVVPTAAAAPVAPDAAAVDPAAPADAPAEDPAPLALIVQKMVLPKTIQRSKLLLI